MFPESQGQGIVRESVSLEAFLDGALIDVGILPFHKPDRREDQLGHMLRALGHTVSSLVRENMKSFLKVLHLRVFRDQGQMLQTVQS